jgi:hypothetical protein
MIHDLSNSNFVDHTVLRGKFDRYLPTPGFQWLTIFYRIPMTLDLRTRKGSFANPWNTKIHPGFEYPELEYSDRSLSDVYDRRCLELFKNARYTGREITLQWSGGVDSTSMLVSFLKNLPQQDHEILTVAMSTNSILENIDFYRDHIHKKLKVVNWLDVDVTNEFLDRNMLLHGDPANCLFGPSGSMYANLVPSGDHLSPWKNHLRDIAAAIDSQTSLRATPVDIGDWYVKKISDVLEELNYDHVHTVADWWWWNYFNFRWYASIVRPFVWSRKNTRAAISKENYQYFIDNTFYAGLEFQQWSYSNLSSLIGRWPDQTFKLDAKKYIFDYDGNKTYHDRKKFQASRATNYHEWQYSSVPVYYDQNWVGHHWHEHGVRAAIERCIEEYQ